jgi:glycosyltransferase involved in cell wall biosynthesis
MSKLVLFHDLICPKPYTIETVKTEAVGGTEATILRIAKGLHSREHSVALMQRGRTQPEVIDGIVYITPEAELTPNIVVTLRDAGHYRANQKKYPNAQHYLWMHDVVSGDYITHMQQHIGQTEPAQLLAVSNWHSAQIQNALFGLNKGLTVTTVYNPVETYGLTRAPYDEHKLIFLSSPHKGLDQVLDIFKQVREVEPRFKLCVANPGYFKDAESLPEGVVQLGQLPHREMIKELATSLCLFYPQNVFPETFGLVMAEANALGVPVLTSSIGAAPEILENPYQMQVYLNPKRIVNTVIEWSKHRPIVRGKRQFELENVLNVWESLLN